MKSQASDAVGFLFIGNSFTHGDPLAVEFTWPKLFSDARNTTYTNIAVGGYGIDQALLRFIDEDVVCDTVFFGVVSGDLERALDPVYNLYLGNNKTKPRFVFNDSGYYVVNQPALKNFEFEAAKVNKDHPIFRQMHGYKDYLYGDYWWSYSVLIQAIVSILHQRKFQNDVFCYLRQESDEFAYCLNIFDLFRKTCEEKNTVGIVILLDNGLTFFDKERFQLDNPWRRLQSALDSMGILNVDFHDELYRQYKIEAANDIHPTEGVHYSKTGHELVANNLTLYLENK